MDEDQKTVTESEKLFEKIKKMAPSTLIGLSLIIIFFLFCFIMDIVIRWWVMIPIAGISIYLLYNNLNKTTGLEKKFCIYGRIIFYNKLSKCYLNLWQKRKQ